MEYDFDTPLSRAGTCAEKYTALERLFGRADLLPFWVADMEFATSPAVVRVLKERAAHPVYGYTSMPASLPAAVTAWNRKRYGLEVGEDAVIFVPGVMVGVAAALQEFTEPGDGVVVQPPLYPPLMETVRRNRRNLIENPLIVHSGRYEMDFEGLERIMRHNRPRMLLLCAPHNPVGRVWNREEMARLVSLVQEHDVCLVSDEIHADLVYPPYKQVSPLSLDRETPCRTIVLNAASKSFNVPGLCTAYALIPDPTLHAAFRRRLRRLNLSGVNLFGMLALDAAYREGEEWLGELLPYLQANRDRINQVLERDFPGMARFVPEGTTLYWLDFSSLGFKDEEVERRLREVARVALNDGRSFGENGGGFRRFNFAVPRSMLEEGLVRILRAFG
ncbi:MAG: cystathionine beta-lyase PatB [Desulfobulbaceae bacterium]